MIKANKMHYFTTLFW